MFQFINRYFFHPFRLIFSFRPSSFVPNEFKKERHISIELFCLYVVFFIVYLNSVSEDKFKDII